MGQRNGKALIETSDILKEIPSFEIALIKKKFLSLSQSSNNNIDTAKINKDSFIANCLYPLFQDRYLSLIELLFSLIDENTNGTIEYSEYLLMNYYFYYCDRDEKIRLLFVLFDSSKNGTLFKKELKKLFATMEEGGEDNINNNINKINNNTNNNNTNNNTIIEQKSTSIDKSKDLNLLLEEIAYLSIYNYDRDNDNGLSYAEFRRLADEEECFDPFIDRLKNKSYQWEKFVSTNQQKSDIITSLFITESKDIIIDASPIIKPRPLLSSSPSFPPSMPRPSLMHTTSLKGSKINIASSTK